MNENSAISWSSFSSYDNCPQGFLWRYGWGDIDLGRGPGKGREVPIRRSAHHAIMGTVIQAVLEKMYQDEMIKDPKNLSKRLLELVDVEWEREASRPRNFIDVAEAKMSIEEMRQTCRDGVLGYLKTMKAHRFWGTYSKAELSLIGWINKWVSVVGRPDVVIRREDSGITILDGKNTKYKMSGVNTDQLHWYAMLFKLAYKRYPDRLGFVWYRFPKGTQTLDPETGEVTEEEGVSWIPFSEEDIQKLAQRVVVVRDGMRFKKFEATPKPPTCKYCDFESVCPERQAQRQENAAKRPSKKIESLEGADGFLDFSLD